MLQSEQQQNTRDNIHVWLPVARCSPKAEVVKALCHDAIRPLAQDGHKRSTEEVYGLDFGSTFKSNTCLLLSNLDKRHSACNVNDSTLRVDYMIRKGGYWGFQRCGDEWGDQVDTGCQRIGMITTKKGREFWEGARPRLISPKGWMPWGHRRWFPGVKIHNLTWSSNNEQFPLHFHFC